MLLRCCILPWLNTRFESISVPVATPLLLKCLLGHLELARFIRVMRGLWTPLHENERRRWDLCRSRTLDSSRIRVICTLASQTENGRKRLSHYHAEEPSNRHPPEGHNLVRANAHGGCILVTTRSATMGVAPHPPTTLCLNSPLNST
jgi:hypothetical protein